MIQHVHGSSHGLFWCTNLPGGTEENNKQSEAGKQLSGLRYESMYFKMKAGMDQSQVGSQGYHISRSCDRLTAPPEKWFADSKKSEKKKHRKPNIRKRSGQSQSTYVARNFI